MMNPRPYLPLLCLALLACGEEDTPADLPSDAGPSGDAPEAHAVDFGAWDEANEVHIALSNDGVEITGEGAAVEGSRVTISAGGVYRVTGRLSDGALIIDSEDEEIVRLILDGVTIHSASTSPLQALEAEALVIHLAAGTTNALSDTSNYDPGDDGEEAPNATLFSRDDLYIEGEGALVIEARYNDGIGGKDGLIISGGDVTIDAVDDGARGKDYLEIQGGVLRVTAGGDGLKSDQVEEGYVLIAGGEVEIEAGDDAINATIRARVSGGALRASAGGKGVVAGREARVDGGEITLDCVDDALHSDGEVIISGGRLELASGDDGIHADGAITLDDGEVIITRSNEGLEAKDVTINGGALHLTSSDDGINVAGGVDGSSEPSVGGPGGGEVIGDNHLIINGGLIVMDAGGDGLDSNGHIEINGGVALINGPTETMNGALDSNGDFTMNGGLLIAAGSADMPEAPSQTSTQPAALVILDAPQAAGALFHVQGSTGEAVLTFAPSKAYQSVAFSAPGMPVGESYEVYVGGASTGEASDGLYEGGAYTGGALAASFTQSSASTTVGEVSGGLGRR